MRLLLIAYSVLILFGISACSKSKGGSAAGGSTNPVTNNAVPTIEMTCGSNECIQ